MVLEAKRRWLGRRNRLAVIQPERQASTVEAKLCCSLEGVSISLSAEIDGVFYGFKLFSNRQAS